MGPILSLPLGLALLTVIVIVVYILVSELLWKRIDHYPEDEEAWDEKHHFVIDDE